MESFPGMVSWIFFGAAALSALAGKTLVRGHSGWLYREEEPGKFWLTVGVYTFMGFFMLYVSHHLRTV